MDTQSVVTKDSMHDVRGIHSQWSLRRAVWMDTQSVVTKDTVSGH